MIIIIRLIMLIAIFNILSHCTYGDESTSRTIVIYDTIKVEVYDTISVNQSGETFKGNKDLYTIIGEIDKRGNVILDSYNDEIKKYGIQKPVLSTYRMNADLDSDYEIIVVQTIKPNSEYKNEESSYITNYYFIDNFNENYFIADSLVETTFGDMYSRPQAIISDLDNNRIDELIVTSSTVNSMGSDFYDLNVLNIVNGKINKTVNRITRHYLFNNVDNSIYLAYPIWGDGECRLCPHFYEVKQLKYIENEFVIVAEMKTSKKHFSEELDIVEVVSDAINDSRGMSQDITITINLESLDMLSNDHVGNEWSYNTIINGEEFTGDSYTFDLSYGTDLIIISVMSEENEPYIDRSRHTVIVSYDDIEDNTNKDLISEVTVVEKNGRYAGNEAKFRFVYSLKIE
ncbi:hypothetical protein CEQ90_19865 [Lewinellaceae bacterium SD302]|nr:hypothetical protein CEQ90_19865 [Lewinellaceae bacterium SD302]